MAKKNIVKFSGVKQVGQNLLKFINAQVKDERLLQEVGKLTIEQIKARTVGKQEEYKQDPLKEVSIEARKYYSDFYQVSEFSTPKVSNLSLTGQLLNSLRYMILSNGIVKIFLSSPRNNRRVDPAYIKEKYNELLDKDYNATNSKRKNPKDKNKITALFLLRNQKDKTNIQIKNDLEKKGRRFFFISDNLNIRLQNRIAQILRTKLSTYRRYLRK